MRNLIKLFLMLTLVVSFSSCEKFSGGGDSITGGWRCREESSSLGIRQYTVNIDRYDVDTTIYVIYNFYNINDIEVYLHLKDTVATIMGASQGYNITGHGYVSRDFKSIDWEYNISGSGINDNYVNARYTR